MDMGSAEGEAIAEGLWRRLRDVALAERVNDLVQVGLVTRVLERDAVERTTAGQGCVAVVEAVAARLGAKCREGLPPLLGR